MPSDTQPPNRTNRFRLGINYWPARTAMGWWTLFEPAEVGADFARIAAGGFDSVRLSLLWEDFQPAPDTVHAGMLQRLVTVADLADQAGLAIMPTLFTGHMSGVNWIPTWALGGTEGDNRFRVMSGGRIANCGLGNWYTDEAITRAQALLAGEAATVLSGHNAVWAWDLGNESSNCVVPPSRSSARTWLDRITTAIRIADQAVLITVGLHMEDLEEDRKLGPGEASEFCDFLSMHGYPIYTSWAEGPTDEHLLPFLAHVTRWLGDGRELLFSEFGLPTYRACDPSSLSTQRQSRALLVEEEAAAAYIGRALGELHRAGCAGAMMWCYSDYLPAIWSVPPLDEAVHERFFGQWRADGAPKPSLSSGAAFTGVDRRDGPSSHEWLDIEPDEFWEDPGRNLARLYGRYRQVNGVNSSSGV
ncbi:MAG: cellulase family glycosylhydrolase [Acidimicrobiia bacterium]